MIVVDASVLSNVLGDDGADGVVARAWIEDAGELMAPDLVDVETVSVLRKRWLSGDLTEARFGAAINDLESVPLVRYPMLPLMRRAFELRANITAYDATYVALAEGLGCPLATSDLRLAKAPGPECEIQVVRSAS